MLEYNFNIDTYNVNVKAEVENEYHVQLDGVFAGVIYPEFIDEPPFLIWKTKDLIAEDLVQKIGAAIEDE
jgi:hypothetical protein